MERPNLNKYGQPQDAKNEQIVQIHKDACALKLPITTSTIWVLEWMGKGETRIPPTILKSKILRVVKKAASLRRTPLEKFMKEPFHLPDAYLDTHPSTSSSTTLLTPDSESVPSTSSFPVPSSVLVPSSPSPQVSTRYKRNTPTKRANTIESEIIQKQRKVSSLDRRIKKLNEGIEECNRRSGHFNIKNVRKRDERNRRMRDALRIEKNKQKRLAKQYEEENARLKTQLKEFQKENAKLKERMKGLQRKTQKSVADKRVAERRMFYHRRRSEKMRRANLESKEHQLTKAEQVGNEAEESMIETKSRDGQYTPATRLCVMDLLGLEVATGKIAAVMESVGRLCSTRFSCLPSRQICQKIADEGQVIAKMFVKDRVFESRSFGIHKDGTTRKKVKILDTSVVTRDGEAYCLGWSSVSSETGKAIAEEGKEKLGELVEEDEEMVKLMKSLQYTMSDRAANEKKSNEILEEWRKQKLSNYGEENASKIHHLFCLAHVLLGFQSYTISGIKKLDRYDNGDLKHPIVVILKDSSDLFGPVGDYRGIRNQWEAFCIENNIRSTIKAYKDNRFNGLFEVSAQVFHHHKSFVTLLEAQSSLNFKQTRLLKSLKNPDLVLLMECLAIFFHKVTGPFWSIAITKIVAVNMLSTTIQQLEKDLLICSEDPHHIFRPDSFNFHKFRSASSSQETKESLSKEMKKEMKEVIVTISNSLLSTVRKQLADFLMTGKYGSSSSSSSLDHLDFAPLSNLVCERNFGHLDSSQRRRPHSSLHHHTSVILLKQTRKNLRSWYQKLTPSEKKELWERARKKGNFLRKKHQQQDRNAIMESLPTFKMAPMTDRAMIEEHLKKDQMVAVACQDHWYPGKKLFWILFRHLV